MADQVCTSGFFAGIHWWGFLTFVVLFLFLFVQAWLYMTREEGILLALNSIVGGIMMVAGTIVAFVEPTLVSCAIAVGTVFASYVILELVMLAIVKCVGDRFTETLFYIFIVLVMASPFLGHYLAKILV